MPGFTTEPRTPTIKALLQDVYHGRLLIPRFQRRGLQWDAVRRLELFDSIYRGFPIGSLLVWRTETHTLETRSLVGLIRGPAIARETVGPRDYLLDGHQRVSVLYTALGPGLFDEVPALDDDEDEIDFRWPVCFDLRANGGVNRFVQSPRGNRPPHLVPLDRLFDAYRLDEVKDDLRAAGGTREEVNRLVELADVFRNAQVPVVPVVTEELRDATTSFKRVNSGGVRMDEVDMVHALSWSKEFDLEDALERAASQLDEVGWRDFPRADVLAVVKRRLGMSVYKTDAEELAGKLRERPALLAEAVEAIATVSRLLASVGFLGPAALPYTAQAVLLATGLDPTTIDPAHARSWIVRTALTERFAGATDTTLNEEAGALASFLRGGETPRVVEVDPVRRFDFRTARCRLLAYILALHARERDVLGELGPAAVVQLVPGSRAEPLTSTVGNRFVLRAGGLAGLRAALRGGEPVDLSRHFIDDTFLDLYRAGQVKQALDHRRSQISDMERFFGELVGVVVREADP